MFSRYPLFIYHYHLWLWRVLLAVDCVCALWHEVLCWRGGRGLDMQKSIRAWVSYEQLTVELSLRDSRHMACDTCTATVLLARIWIMSLHDYFLYYRHCSLLCNGCWLLRDSHHITIQELPRRLRGTLRNIKPSLQLRLLLRWRQLHKTAIYKSSVTYPY